MSRGAVSNPDRRREIREIEIPPAAAAGMEPGTRGYRMGRCTIFVSRWRGRWHLSISRPDRLPSWEDVRDARYALIPDESRMVMHLPPRDEYVNVHEFCFQLHEIEES